MNKGSFYLCVIGSAAGGLDALTKLFLAISPKSSKVAFIITHYLNPDYANNFVELLSLQTNFKVIKAKDKTIIKPGIIYVASSEFRVTVKNRTIQLKKSTVLYKSFIDTLFTSAAVYKQKTIGIILSGNGDDGKQGLIEIKTHGGLTIAEDTSRAGSRDIPAGVGSPNAVHLILRPDSMGDAINQYVQAGQIKSNVDQDGQITENAESVILKMLSDYYGTDFSNYKLSTITRRIERRMALLQLSDMDEYLDHLKKHLHELEVLYRSFMIGVTSFFRDKDAFRFLEKKLGNLIENQKNDVQIRIWVPACASGAEAYTVAIISNELLHKKNRKNPIQIFATDIDEEALKKARKGIYQLSDLKNIDAKILNKYFSQSGKNFQVHKDIRSVVQFSKHDITIDPPFSNLDVLSCRNLLIYFNQKLQSQTISIFHYALNNNGLLMLGKSESVNQNANLFKTEHSKYKFYSKEPAEIHQGLSDKNFKIKNYDKQAVEIKKSMPSMEELLKENIYEQFDFPYVVVNEKMDLVHVKGEVSPYLSFKPGKISMNIVKNSDSTIQIELLNVLTKCISQSKKITGDIKRIDRKNGPVYLKLKAYPLIAHKVDNIQNLYQIVYEEVSCDYFDFFPAPSTQNIEEGQHGRVIELERELDEAKEQLKSMIEELGTSNEELQSLNEELQSTKEEFQATNEELITSNEELISANQEMILAYSELKELHRLLKENKITLDKSESRFRSIIEQFPYAVVTYTADGMSTGANKAWEVLWNDKRENAMNYNIRKDPQMIASGLSKYVEKAFAGEVALSHAYMYDPSLIGHIGRKRWIQMLLYPIKDNTGKVEEVILILQDVTDTHEAAAKIRASESRFRALIEKNNDIMTLSIPEGEIFYASPSIKTVLGYEPTEIIGKEGIPLMHPDYVFELKEKLENILEATGKSFSITLQAKHKNGSWRWLAGTITNMLGEEGVNALVSNFRDVTEKRAAEELLQKSESNLRSVFNHTDTGLILLDTNFNIVLFNNIANEWAKLSLGTFYSVGVNIISLIPDGQKDDVLERYSQNLQGKISNYELHRMLNDGSSRWFHVRQYPVRNNGSTVIGLCIAIDEITERKNAEESLRLAEVNYREIFEKGNDAIYIHDINTGKLLDVNERACEITGYSREELLTGNLEDHITGVEGFLMADAMNHMMIAAKGDPHIFEWLGKRRDGSFYWLEVNLSKAAIAGVDRILAFFREIDDRKKAEEELKSFSQNLEHLVTERTAELEITNKELEAFSYSISHDLRAPLRAIHGYSRILEDENVGKLNDMATQSLKYVQQNALKMSNQIDGLLKFSKFGRRAIVKYEVNMVKLVNGILHEISHATPHKADIKINVLLSAFADHDLITHVWTNLLSNAIKYSAKRETPQIEIASNKQGGEIIYCIKDNGAGFEMKYADKLFGVFQRLHRIDEFEGTGVGLAIVQRIITKHGGRVWAEGVVNEGACFYFSLPE